MALDHFYLKITKVCVVLTIYSVHCPSPFVLSTTVTADFEVKAQLHVCHFACSAPLHYRFWAIRGGPFGVVNFASHFFCIQIFQMETSALPLILSASKYSRRPKMNDPPFASFSCIIIVKTSRQRITKITAGREMGLVELGKYLIHK